ncbi:MAG: HEAT repeat domain-containing protein [Planctomycetes bacterium]|nr:HEAT repeat domain-containing protein [Planctomycetota bacterium]MBI3848393.1 HEAT repeat domain-containing protein [Planctomycetota bacterium]
MKAFIVRFPLCVALTTAAAAIASGQACPPHPPAFAPAGQPSPAPSPSPSPSPTPAPRPGGDVTPRPGGGTTPRTPGTRGGVTKPGGTARQTGSFDWRAWWEANRWRYLTFQSVVVEKTGSREAIASEPKPTGDALLSDPSRGSAIAKLREVAASSRDSLAREAFSALVSVAGGDAAKDITGAATGGDPDRRLSAMLAASRLESTAGIDELRAALRDSTRSSIERGAAAVVLGIRGDSASRDAMAALANDARQSLEARVGAVIGLGVSGSDSTRVVCDILRRDKEARVLKLAAAFALGRSGDSQAVAALAETVRTGDSADLRRAAAASLGALSVHGKHPIAGTSRTQAADALVFAATSDTDLAVRGLALISLGQTGSGEGHRECLRILKEGSGELVVPAMLAIAISGDMIDGEAIVPFLNGNAAYRAPAALALGILHYDAAKTQLRDLFEKTNDRSVKQFTALALGFLRDVLSAPAISRFIVEAGDRDGWESAAQALGLMGSYPAVVALRGAADSAPNAEARAFALEMLGRVRDMQSQRRFEDVLAASNKTDQERTAAVRGLGYLASPVGYVPPIREVFCDRDYDLKGPLFKALVASL